MKLSLNDIKEEEKNLLGACGIICACCDGHTGESRTAAKTVIKIWEESNLADVAFLKDLNSQEVLDTIKVLKKYTESKSCDGCSSKQRGSGCPIGKCVQEKGYWTCAECEDYDHSSTSPCPHSDGESFSLLEPPRSVISANTCKRYCSNTIHNIKRCREIGYPAFIEEIKEKVQKGWRTWEVISEEMVISRGY